MHHYFPSYFDLQLFEQSKNLHQHISTPMRIGIRTQNHRKLELDPVGRNITLNVKISPLSDETEYAQRIERDWLFFVFYSRHERKENVIIKKE